MSLTTGFTMNRRTFLSASAGLLAGTAFADTAKKPKLRKAVKYGMIGEGKTVQDKFELIKKIGFEGVEIDSPPGSTSRRRTPPRRRPASRSTASSTRSTGRTRCPIPDEKVRAKGLEALLGAIDDAEIVGADTVLLVPGVVNKDVTYEQCWERSQAEVKKALPAGREGRGQDRHRGRLEQLHHQAGAVRRVRRQFKSPMRRRRTSTARTWSSTACRRPTGSASSASGC